jgi:inosine-uridine nucleoside N-ribohydrolase
MLLALALLAGACSSEETESRGAPVEDSTTTTAGTGWTPPPCEAPEVEPVRAEPVPGVDSDLVVTSFDDTPIRVHWFPHPDATEAEPAPTVLMGPGWGLAGDTDVDSIGVLGGIDIASLRTAGYNVLTWDPRGFGQSGGVATVNDPDNEGRDVQRLIDWVSAQPEARLNAPGDPAMGMVGTLIGLVSGPLTNLALALRAEPDLPRLLRRLVIMGGSFDYRGNTTPVAEWNTSVDPEAAAEVLDAWARAVESETVGPESLPIVCGLNLTENVVLTPQIMQRLAETAGATATANPLITVLEDAMRFYFEFHFSQGEGYLAHLHDPLAAAVALDPDLIATRSAAVAVELTGTLTRGMTIADWSGRWGREPNARVGVEVDPAAFFTRFIDRVGPFARRLTARRLNHS